MIATTLDRRAYHFETCHNACARHVERPGVVRMTAVSTKRGKRMRAAAGAFAATGLAASAAMGVGALGASAAIATTPAKIYACYSDTSPQIPEELIACHGEDQRADKRSSFEATQLVVRATLRADTRVTAANGGGHTQRAQSLSLTCY